MAYLGQFVVFPNGGDLCSLIVVFALPSDRQIIRLNQEEIKYHCNKLASGASETDRLIS